MSKNHLPDNSDDHLTPAVSQNDAVARLEVPGALPDTTSHRSNVSTVKKKTDFWQRWEFWQHNRKSLLTAFLVWNIVSIGFHLCAPCIFRDRVLTALNPYLWYTGLWQDYCVFAPNPKDYDIQMSAAVHLKNGTTCEYLFPHPARESTFGAMSAERFRKWAHDNVNHPTFKVWWPDTCRWIARKYMKDPNNPPVQIDLIRQFSAILPPGSSPSYGPNQQVCFYSYQLQPGDF